MYSPHIGLNASKRSLPCSRDKAGPALKVMMISLVMMLCFLVAPGQTIAGESITEVTVIYGANPNPAVPAGYTKIEKDLNRDADGDYIFICYKKGNGAPITGLAVTLGDDLPAGHPATFYKKINVDLNRNADGAYIYLWYTKDPNCTSIRNLHVQSNTGAPPAGYTRIDVDLNTGAGGAFIYLSYEEF